MTFSGMPKIAVHIDFGMAHIYEKYKKHFMHEIVNVYRRYINVTHCFYGKFVLRFMPPLYQPDKGRQKWI